MTPRITGRALLGAALALVVACSTDRSGLDGDGGADTGRDTSDADGAGGGSTGGATGSGGGSATGGGTVTGGRSGTGGMTATGGRSGTGGMTATGGRSGTGGVTATGGRSGTGGGSGICGGIAGLTCPANTFCQHSAGLCNAPDASGTCIARPVVCAEIYAPVCGCDNHTYDNDCTRQGAGVSKRADGMCNPAGCPDAAPTPGAACPTAAINCRYPFANDPFCWSFFMCAQGLTWGQPQTACALASSLWSPNGD